jgi:hypothetical protein
MKKLLFVVLAVFVSFRTYSQITDPAPITWEQPTVSKDTLNITYRNISNESLSSIIFTVEYRNSDGLTRRFAARDPSPPRNNSSITSRWQIPGGINSSEPVRIFDIEVRFNTISRSTWQLSASQLLEGDPSIYLERSLSDILNGNLSSRQAYRRDTNGNLYHNLVSNVYLKDIREDSSRFVILYDNIGNELFSFNSSNFIIKYNIAENNNFKPEQQYRVRYTLLTLYNTALNISSRDPMDKVAVLESVEGLLSYEEVRNIEKAESQRVANEIAERRRAEAEAEAAQKRIEAEAEAARKRAEAEVAKKRAEAEAEAAYQNALASRNVETIMRFLRSGALTPLSSDRRTELRNEGLLEAAKIITRNNNIQIGNFDDSFVNSTLNPINPYAFDTAKIYHLAVMQPQQFIEGKIIAIAVLGFPNATVLLQNIPNIQNVRGSLNEVFMRYTGITTLKLANDSTKEVATFDVLYHYRGD